MCDHEAVEDEFHFLIQCPLYQEERAKMYAVYATEIGSLNVLSDMDKFILIMSSKSIKNALKSRKFHCKLNGKKRHIICIH